ncbi:hypothetical protein A4R26_21975 [Niastella populi]|uniref:Uncharacterized protein n=1 Tax=Niastella populi TaxID=550983 RepID=A0A1V9FL37_9BACT|nr:hypothetical protein A4R26_21975 [Niastella populi]
MAENAAILSVPYIQQRIDSGRGLQKDLVKKQFLPEINVQAILFFIVLGRIPRQQLGLLI